MESFRFWDEDDYEYEIFSILREYRLNLKSQMFILTR